MKVKNTGAGTIATEVLGVQKTWYPNTILTFNDDDEAAVKAAIKPYADLSISESSGGSISGKFFKSTVQTGTGSSQNIAHGLAVVPSNVMLSIYDTNGVALPHAMAEGAHDATNVKATVTSGVKFVALAIV